MGRRTILFSMAHLRRQQVCAHRCYRPCLVKPGWVLSAIEAGGNLISISYVPFSSRGNCRTAPVFSSTMAPPFRENITKHCLSHSSPILKSGFAMLPAGAICHFWRVQCPSGDWVGTSNSPLLGIVCLLAEIKPLPARLAGVDLREYPGARVSSATLT